MAPAFETDYGMQMELFVRFLLLDRESLKPASTLGEHFALVGIFFITIYAIFLNPQLIANCAPLTLHQKPTNKTLLWFRDTILEHIG